MADDTRALRFKDVLLNIDKYSYTQWVYLPRDERWSLESRCAVLEDDEVPPEMEEEPEAGVPEFAKLNRLKRALTVTAVQDVLANARQQLPEATREVLFQAFMYYHEHDAFLVINRKDRLCSV